MNPQQKFTRRSRAMNASTAVFALVSILLLGFKDQIVVLLFGANRFSIEEGRYAWVERQIFAIGLAFAAVAFFLVLLRYLRGEISVSFGPLRIGIQEEPDLPSFESARISNLEAQIKRLEVAITRQGSQSPVAAIENIEAALLDRVIQEVPAKLAEQLNSNTLRQRSIVQTRDGLYLGRKRLEFELASLGRRGTVNLAIGSVTTAVAVVLLYQAATTPPQSTDLMTLFTFYIPRVTLAIFVEVFSFFFLRLYRTGLIDLKYFHGELMNLDLRIAALDTAMLIDDQESLRHVISSLVDTDRTKQLSPGHPSQTGSGFDEKLVLNVVEAALKLSKPEKTIK